jgi:glyoxylate/hydroxypyruvate reductase
MMQASLLVDEREQSSWLAAMRAPLHSHGISLTVGENPAAQIAIVANPPVGALRNMPNIKLIASLWAGVDRLLADTSIARHIPILRACDAQMRQSMTESVLAHVLRLHLKHHLYQDLQHRAHWQALDARVSNECRVTVLGMGYLGGHAATALDHLGFQVTGWSRGTPRERRLAASIQLHSGVHHLANALKHANIVVNLLPDTPQTRGILCARTFALAPRGLSVINLARGHHLVEQDLLEALAQGQVSHATLDVFSTEPLVASHPFWCHPNLTVTPHIAAPSHRNSVSKSVSDDIALWLSGTAPESLVNRAQGY